jgi:DNA-binding transcriptional LysR family regulator
VEALPGSLRLTLSHSSAPQMDINIARFDLVSIRLAVLCAESGSLSAATRLAHCSISTGSERLAALEGAFGKSLFVRDHRGLRLTPAGNVFVRHARVLLQNLEVLKQQVAGLHEVPLASDEFLHAGQPGHLR